MAANNLFPPIVDDYLPAFLQAGNSCKIVFKLAQFNKVEDFDLDLTQITISNLNTNKSMLNPSKYPNEIKIAKAEVLNKANKTYFIKLDNIESKKDENGDIISWSLLKTNQFELNTYYKVQIRLTKAGTPKPEKEEGTSSWFNGNLENFSEWSTVCLIRAIATPVLQLHKVSDTNVLSAANIVGKLTFSDDAEKESIYTYKVLVMKNSNIIEDSGFIYPEPTKERELNYTFKTNVIGEDFSAQLYIVTKNGYIIGEDTTYKINVTESSEGNLGAEIFSITPDEENGLMQININVTADQGISDHKIILKRASSLNDFNTWDDLLVYDSNSTLDKNTHLIFNDLSIQSGVWYKYAIQGERKTDKARTAIVYDADLKNANMAIFEHMFLVAEGQQLKIKYNPTVSTYKRNIQESQTTTLGAQFPFIRRNGSMDYYQLSISGMISAISDEDEIKVIYQNGKETNVENISRGRLFGSKVFIYGGEHQAELYEGYNQSENISKYNDIIYEKMFRDKVIDFLYKDNVKLFKSTPEGNRLVKIMNVNLTPETGLGRYIYSFSCDAIEIAEPSVDNLLENKIQTDMIEIG